MSDDIVQKIRLNQHGGSRITFTPREHLTKECHPNGGGSTSAPFSCPFGRPSHCSLAQPTSLAPTCMHTVFKHARESAVSGWLKMRSVSPRRRSTLAADESRKSRWFRNAETANSLIITRFWRSVIRACDAWRFEQSARRRRDKSRNIHVYIHGSYLRDSASCFAPTT